jgi:hypothetical protein
MKSEIPKLIKLYSTYGEIHARFKQIEDIVQKLEEERKVLSELLSITREEENSIINKIEKETGVKPSVNDLLEIIKTHEQIKS